MCQRHRERSREFARFNCLNYRRECLIFIMAVNMSLINYYSWLERGCLHIVHWYNVPSLTWVIYLSCGDCDSIRRKGGRHSDIDTSLVAIAEPRHLIVVITELADRQTSRPSAAWIPLIIWSGSPFIIRSVTSPPNPPVLRPVSITRVRFGPQQSSSCSAVVTGTIESNRLPAQTFGLGTTMQLAPQITGSYISGMQD